MLTLLKTFDNSEEFFCFSDFFCFEGKELSQSHEGHCFSKSQSRVVAEL